MRPAMSRPWIAAGLATVAVGLAGGELAARWLDSGDERYVPPVASDDSRRPHDDATLGRPNARFLWLGQPGRLREYTVFVRLNSWGLHDREHSFAKPSGSRRVLVVGDSFVEALQVPLEAGLPRLLARRLDTLGVPADVVAIGRSGWGPVEYRAAIGEWAPKLDADVVVLVLYSGNDVRNASPEAERIFREQIAGPLGQLWSRPPDRDLPGVFVPGSRLNVLLARLALLRRARARVAEWDSRYKMPVDLYTFVEEEVPFIEDGWRRLALEVEGAASDLARQGRRLLVVSTSDALRMQTPRRLRASLERDYAEAKRWHWDFDRFEARLGPLLGKAKVPWVDLHARFAGRMREEPAVPHFLADGHWNETGHRWAADAVAPEVAALLER
jgi:lysophospholipase L1-like esterase